MTPNRDSRLPLINQANWRQKLVGAKLVGMSEARLYTDAWVIGELPELGPFSVLNTVAGAGDQSERVTPGIVLRVFHHELPSEYNGGIRQRAGKSYRAVTDDRHHHGGDLVDEMAALFSLFVGIRLQAGPIDREFRDEQDRFGRPIAYGLKARPFLPAGREQLPRLSGPKKLQALQRLEKLPLLSVEDVGSLVKIARLYQQAVWMANAEPSLAWLLLVSAIETAAASQSNQDITSADLASAMPDVAALLVKKRLTKIMPELSRALSTYIRATAKFANFLVSHAPPPPDQRPKKWIRASFKPNDIGKSARLIYRYRSNALHDGRAFPAPMCKPPEILRFGKRIDKAHTERPMGLAQRIGNHQWDGGDMPMLLHVFEYITQHAIMRWFDRLQPVWSASMPAVS